MTAAIALIIPFALTFLIPGSMGAFLALRKKNPDILLFIITSSIIGIACQIGIGFLASLLFFLNIEPAARVVIAVTFLIIILAYGCLRTWQKGTLPKITVSAYSIATLLITGVLGISLYGIMAHLPQPYFNAASDQYYWLAYAIRGAYDPSIVLSLIIRDPIYQSFFFIMLLPYAAFLPKDLAAYQLFIESWQYGIYALGSIALARLAYEALPMRIWGIIAPLTFYMLHWSNYYMISTDVVPQNIGIFFLIAGFILFSTPLKSSAGIAFLALFYFIHPATFTIFVLSIGAAKIAYEGICTIKEKIWSKKYISEWHIFEKISFIPTFVVVILYGLYGAGALAYYPLENIAYADEYAKNLTLFSQPYADMPQLTLLKLSIVGLVLIPIIAYFDAKRRRLLLALACGFALPWIFLKTPLIAYHAFFASWQSFRYYLVMYPSISILALLPFSIGGLLITKKVSKNLGVGITAIAIILNIPILMRLITMQQELVTLDMITGRDEGKNTQNLIQDMEKFQQSIELYPKGAVISFGHRAITPYNQWIIAPRPWFVTTPGMGCNEKSCMTYDTFAHRAERIWDIPAPGIGIIQKGASKEDEARKLFEIIFTDHYETEMYAIYGNRTAP